MKTLTILFLLISVSSYSQINTKFIERIVNRPIISHDSLLQKANKVAYAIRMQYDLTGDYQIKDDGWYASVVTYLGDTPSVEAAIIEDKIAFSTAVRIFIYNDYDPVTDTNLVLLYTFQ